jgi:hypothetical protein
VTGKEGLKGVDEDGAAGRVPSLSSVHHFRRMQHGDFGAGLGRKTEADFGAVFFLLATKLHYFFPLV